MQTKFEEGLALHQQGRSAEAERLYAEGLEQEPNHFNALHLLGMIALQTSRTQRGVELITKAIRLNPNMAAAYINLGKGLHDLKRPEEALASYDKAIALNPDFAMAYNNRGLVLRELKRHEEAVANFEKAIALNPEFAEAYNNLGNVLLELKRPGEALASCDKAIALNPGFAMAYNNRGLALTELKHPEEAVASFDKAIALKPDLAEAYNNRGLALTELKHPEEAVASFDKAIALKPDFAKAYNNFGNVLLKLKRSEEAIASFEKAVALNPDAAHPANPYDRAARERLADILIRLNLDRCPLGSIARGQLLLSAMAVGFPTARASTAYFENLRVLLQGKARRPTPGQVVLGLGSGRCGSTSLVALLSSVAGSCCTHENPPPIYWQPLPEQIRFQFRRLEILSRYFPLVFDASHWWLNIADQFLSRFVTGRVIGLHREVEACARSFARIKGYGRGTSNHWAAFGNGIWGATLWDPYYPSYALPSGSDIDPDQAKLTAIRRYVADYNQRLAALEAGPAGRVMLVPTEEVADAAVQERIFDFVGMKGVLSERRFNVGTTADSDSAYRF